MYTSEANTMNRTFYPISVIRAVTPRLLQLFCQSHHIELKPELFANGVDPALIYMHSTKLPDDQRQKFDTALRDIYELGTEDGLRLLTGEARIANIFLGLDFLALDGLQPRALWFLIHHRASFHNALRLHAAKQISWKFSTTVQIPISTKIPECSIEAFTPLRVMLMQYFTEHESRGRHCKIEWLIREERLFVLAHLDDHGSVHLDFDEQGELRRRSTRPVFDVVYQLHLGNLQLATFAKGGADKRAELKDLFCEHFLKIEAPEEKIEKPEFHLTQLISPEAAIAPPPSSGIAGVRIRRMRVYFPQVRESITLEVAPEGKTDDIYKMLNRFLPEQDYPRSDLRVNFLSLTITPTEEQTTGKPFSFDVGNRGSTNLTSKREHQQNLGERLFKLWKIHAT
jgi:hypothetical protein